MDLNANVDINCGRKDGQTENVTPILHLAKAVSTARVYDNRLHLLGA